MGEEARFSSDPDAEYPGWVRRKLSDDTRYNKSPLGRMIARINHDTYCHVRTFPQRQLTNLADDVYGAATLELIDCSLFCTMRLPRRSDEESSPATLGLKTQFIDAGDLRKPNKIGEKALAVASATLRKAAVQ